MIDEQGRLCNAVPEVVAALRDYPGADFDIADYAMRNIGWIQNSVNQPEGRVAATFQPLTVSFGAISALYALLSNSDWKSIRFDYDLFGWMTETYQDSGKACAALHVVVRSVIDFYHHPAYTSVEKNPALLREEGAGGSNMLASVLGLWQERSGVLADDLTHRMREIGILPRLMLIGVNSSGSDGWFQYIGSGFTVYGDRWPRDAIGQDIQEQPDKAYAARVAKSCMMDALSSEPRYTHVDACIVDGLPRGSGPDDYIRTDSRCRYSTDTVSCVTRSFRSSARSIQIRKMLNMCPRNELSQSIPSSTRV